MKNFNELTTVEEKKAAIKCGNLCISATRKYRKGDESWSEDFQDLMSILTSQFDIQRIRSQLSSLLNLRKQLYRKSD